MRGIGVCNIRVDEGSVLFSVAMIASTKDLQLERSFIIYKNALAIGHTSLMSVSYIILEQYGVLL